MDISKRNVCSAAEYGFETSNRYRIPTRDGITVGATITRPLAEGAFPALVWYDPYRGGSDGTTSPMARYFAERGYAFVYLNARGTGNSEGVSKDEYMVEETRDGCDAIAWLADQPWCSGRVGMLGTSYSGFTTLQVAAMAPPALKAIAPAYFTDRRYTDDCHYKGGCLRGFYDMLTYGLNMVARNGLPPFREAVGERWSELWQQRLEENEPYLLKWISHQVEDDYWAVGSISGHYDRISAAALLIGGWHDGYPTPPLRVYRELRSPRRLLMGPWSHSYGDQSHCGPRIDIFYELLRWWDHWLKEMDNGVMEEPPVQIYRREYEEPVTDRTMIAGGWRMAEDLPRQAPETFFLRGESLTDGPAAEVGTASVAYLPAACRHGGLWDGGTPFTLPGDQREDSARAINFVSPPLAEPISILGTPTFSLNISSDAEVIPVAVRLLEIAPDGTSVLVTRGILNATRREGMDRVVPMVPGKVSLVAFHMEATAWRFTKGHRIGISINGSDFPNVWPTPRSGRITVHWGPEFPSKIQLPVWGGGSDPEFTYLPSPHPARPTGSGDAPWQVVHDVLEDRYRLVLFGGEGEMGVSNRTPAEAWTRSKKTATVAWPGCDVRSEATGSLTSNQDCFVMNLGLNVYLNGDLYFQKRWSRTVRRLLL
ncbi:MAG: CocE/NonD family hydrolase [Gemmatimonadetes bacterium]|nr:CocE/NonD family hydrolase [Gemmatimonadota bacterium]